MTVLLQRAKAPRGPPSFRVGTNSDISWAVRAQGRTGRESVAGNGRGPRRHAECDALASGKRELRPKLPLPHVGRARGAGDAQGFMRE